VCGIVRELFLFWAARRRSRFVGQQEDGETERRCKVPSLVRYVVTTYAAALGVRWWGVGRSPTITQEYLLSDVVIGNGFT
jgi:hypothetical protein